MKTTSQFIHRLPLLALLLALVQAWGPPNARAASPAPPDLMSYQGYLVDVNGAPLAPSTPANYPIAFRIYDASAGGNVLWAEQQVVTVDKGNFSVVLGEGTAVSGELRPALSSVFGGATASDRYLGIAVTISGTTMTITPRLRLLPSAYAFAATAATSLIDGAGQPVLSMAGGKLQAASELTVNPGPLTVTGNASVSGVATISSLAVSGESTLTGNVGIGTAPSAIAPLRMGGGFANTKIALWDNGGSTAHGLGVQNGQFRLHLNSNSDRFAFLNAPAGTEVLTMKGDGNIGIGTNSPAATLHVNGPTRIEGNNVIEFGGGVTKEANAGKIGYQTFSPGVLDIIGAGPTFPGRKIRFHDHVGIGITSSGIPLHVSGTGGETIGSHTTFSTQGTTAGGTIFVGDVSIKGSHAIHASFFRAVSDARIKNIQGRSEGSRDLETLNRIEITDYQYKDVLTQHSRTHKKVIGQQVETVFPQAVVMSVDVVPDIYRKAPAKDGWVELATDLKKGERVRLVSKTQDGVYEVVEVTSNRFRTDFIPEEDSVFVFGREVNDFRVVDYEAIAMLNVSATQELARRMEALEKSEARIAELEQKTARMAELEAETSRVEALEKRVRELEGVEQQVAELRKLVAELASAAGQRPEPVAAVRPQRGHGD